jgi:hypothetical protein
MKRQECALSRAPHQIQFAQSSSFNLRWLKNREAAALWWVHSRAPGLRARIMNGIVGVSREEWSFAGVLSECCCVKQPELHTHTRETAAKSKRSPCKLIPSVPESGASLSHPASPHITRCMRRLRIIPGRLERKINQGWQEGVYIRRRECVEGIHTGEMHRNLLRELCMHYTPLMYNLLTAVYATVRYGAPCLLGSGNPHDRVLN